MKYLDEFKYVVKVGAYVKFNNSNDDSQLLKQVLQHKYIVYV